MKPSTIGVLVAAAAIGVAACDRYVKGPREKHRAGPLDEIESRLRDERRAARKRQRAARKKNRRGR